MKKVLIVGFLVILGCPDEKNNEVKKTAVSQNQAAPIPVVTEQAVVIKKTAYEMSVREFIGSANRSEIGKVFTDEEQMLLRKATIKYGISQDTAKFFNMTIREAIDEQRK